MNEAIMGPYDQTDYEDFKEELDRERYYEERADALEDQRASRAMMEEPYYPTAWELNPSLR